MILLDTHAWIWWMIEDARLPARVRRRAAATDVGVSSISCLEVVQLERRRRIRLDRGAVAWLDLALAHPAVRALPVDAGIATDAALLDAEAFPADPIDRVIYATARAHGAMLATRDRRIREFDPVTTLW